MGIAALLRKLGTNLINGERDIILSFLDLLKILTMLLYENK